MTQIHPMTDFWDDTFVREIEGKTIDQGVLIWALSGPSFILRTPQSLIYIDPFLGGDFAGAPTGMYRTTAIPINPQKVRIADAVLMTHNHYDHCHRETLQGITAGTKAAIYGPVTVVQDALGFGIAAERIRKTSVGDRFRVGDVNIAVWPGNDPGEAQAICYTLETQGIIVFFAGDSLDGPYLAQIGEATRVDIAMLAFGRTWYMSEAELLVAAARLHPRVLVPYHWELWRGATGDPVKLGQLVERQKPGFALELLLIGQGLEYRPDGSYQRLA